MTISEIKDLASAIQSISIALAALFGGAWAIYQFFSTRAVEKARAEVESMQRKNKELGLADLSLSCNPIDWDQGHLIAVRASIKNIGNTTETIDWTSSNILASKVESTDEQGKIIFSEWAMSGTQDPGLSASTTTVEPGVTQIESFVIFVPEPGIYYVDFTATASSAARKVVEPHFENSGDPLDDGDDYCWYASEIVVVPERLPNNSSKKDAVNRASS